MAAALGQAPPVESFRQLLAQRLGLQLDAQRDDALALLLQRRLAATGLTPAAYFERLQSDSVEAHALAPDVTVAETYFFRHAEQFAALREQLPGRARAAAGGLRLLCAGCASGEEAYSLAIVASELGCPARIDAVDLNPALIEHARRARYGDWSLRETPPLLRQRWFRRDGAHWQLDAGIRAAVRFEALNLCGEAPWPWPPGSVDVVFCRNLLMYLTPAAARTLVARLAQLLVPGGSLFVGHAETLRGLSDGFVLREAAGSFHYRRLDGAAASAVPQAAAARGAAEARAVPRAAAEAGAAPGADASGAWFDLIAGASSRVDALTRRAAAAEPATAPAGQARDARQVTLTAARALLQAERFADALERLDALPANGDADAEALLLRAVALTQSGALADAERCCQRLLMRDEHAAAARYLQALAREAAGDAVAAAQAAQVAARLDPRFALPRLQLARLARRRGDALAQREQGRWALELLQQDDAQRLGLLGGGFSREDLLALARRELAAADKAPGSGQ
ncbi:protein-glutamate O-methyltransferase CheR [Aquincola sp. S2]|uniref:Protein-glutamate O-methyltransferase CheR n=1 Tax=Pseudaquabacterium terrae TaxID=2732868 RepID=A0ABX2EHR2_9BURK|nr:protein-glutamate O-methyltransferase CheR [Aquabacterium terrae]NRF68122.1 protein-glutamate O-methyltransferase CheR [Aquabacterium terrae]